MIFRVFLLWGEKKNEVLLNIGEQEKRKEVSPSSIADSRCSISHIAMECRTVSVDGLTELYLPWAPLWQGKSILHPAASRTARTLFVLNSALILGSASCFQSIVGFTSPENCALWFFPQKIVPGLIVSYHHLPFVVQSCQNRAFSERFKNCPGFGSGISFYQE